MANGQHVPLDICEYLFVHAQRLDDKSMLRPINKLRYASKSRSDVGENKKSKGVEELEESESDENDVRRKRKLFQRGLGLFHRLVVDENSVTCTCENFRRFGKCEDSELLGFVFLGEKGHPTQNDAVDFNACKDGYGELSSRLRNKVLNLVDVGNLAINPPQQDPTRVQQLLY